MADAPDSKQIAAALTDAVKSLTTAVNDQKTALTVAIEDQKEALTQALEKIPQAVTPTPPPDRFRGTAADVAVRTFNDIVADLNFVPFEAGTLTATGVSSRQIDLNWTEPNRNPKGFKIERRDASSPTFIQIAELGPNARSYSDGELNKKRLIITKCTLSM